MRADRETVTWLAGLVLGSVILIHEVWAQGVERPVIISAAVALMGFSLVAGARNGMKK